MDSGAANFAEWRPTEELMKRNFARALAAATLLLVGFSAGALTGSVRGATPIECGDLDGNGTIAATDALLLLRRAIDLPGALRVIQRVRLRYRSAGRLRDGPGSSGTPTAPTCPTRGAP